MIVPIFLSSLHVDDWSQGEVTFPELPGGELQTSLAVVAGMLADPSLQRSCTSQLLETTFALAPAKAAQGAVHEVLELASADVADNGDVLASAIEHALAVLEAGAAREGPSRRMEAEVRRELVRALLPGACGTVDDTDPVNDRQLLRELAQTPQQASEAASQKAAACLRREAQALDGYLVRLLRLKRALALRLDQWEKVDHYAILGVSSSCSDKELRNAYRKACLRLHPDKGGDKEQFQRLQDAYAFLLEERERQGRAAPAPAPRPPGASEPPAPGGPPGPDVPAAPGGPGAARGGGRGARPLALEGAAGPPRAGAPAAAAEECASSAEERARSAEDAAARVQALRKAVGGEGLERLRAAQEAGEALQRLSRAAGELGPRLGELAMEVAECSLALSARFSAVPASMLLTDVALSCTFEACRMQHAARQLLEVGRDTASTLQALKSSLDMGRVVGTVDGETLKLSLGLLGKAAARMLSSLRQLASAVRDAAQRGRQCGARAKMVAAFAERRAASEEAAADEPAAAAIGGPEGWAPGQPAPEASTGPEGRGAPDGQGAQQGAAPAAPCGGQPQVAPPPPGCAQAAAMARLLEARMQNDRLLRQLNADVLHLQQRSRTSRGSWASPRPWRPCPSAPGRRRRASPPRCCRPPPRSRLRSWAGWRRPRLRRPWRGSSSGTSASWRSRAAIVPRTCGRNSCGWRRCWTRTDCRRRCRRRSGLSWQRRCHREGSRSRPWAAGWRPCGVPQWPPGWPEVRRSGPAGEYGWHAELKPPKRQVLLEASERTLSVEHPNTLCWW
ncbi:unnamed protein product [Prorocentrum cordatum]|uniref:J domain-containing protein n=2 Tax=Prorocentrum cordatum TaxID=2364126 RepID=A0ABN9VPC0_9DINO|nr:unnamed protein product [Polarella glacialis]